MVSLEDEQKLKSRGATSRRVTKIMKESESESEIEFIGKLKSFRDQEFINIKNPEYILSLLAEDSLMHMI